ncbi:TPA: hypothetical protein OOF36_003334, partial [Morganella morganii]|nr:hypothetical protein [Morganella morganii]
MKTAKYKLAVLATAVSFSLFSAGSYAKDGETPTYRPESFDAGKVGKKDPLGREIKVGNQCKDRDGVAGECRNNAIDYLYDKIKDFSPEQITASKNEAINAGQNAANKAEANANASTDKKISSVKNELNNAINNVKNEAVSAGKTAADSAEKSANSYTDKKVTEGNSRTDDLISKEQKARTDALNA